MIQENMMEMEVTGMTCTDCERHVEQALKEAGATTVRANFRLDKVRFQFPDSVSTGRLKEAVNQTGYHAGNVTTVIQEEPRDASDSSFDYDFIIIGSGGAAFSAAIKATEYGAKVAMIERGTVGGTCVNIGCVPSKTLLRAGEINQLAKSNPFQGLHTSAGPVNLKTLVDQKDELVEGLRQQKYIDLIKEYGIDLIKGEARFVDEKTIQVNGTQQLTAHRYLIAAGASPAIPDIPGLSDVSYLTSTSLLELKELPRSLAIIGSGYIGLELGQLFHNLGADVMLMQRSPRLLKEYDPEISDTVAKFLSEQGITTVTGVNYECIEVKEGLKRIHILVNGEKTTIEAEQILVAIGRTPNTEALHLNAANVEVGPRGEVKVNEFLQTTNSRIYAAGDITLGPQFVYVAAYQGGVAADNAIGKLNKKMNLNTVPGVTFTNPSIATVGLTEQQAIDNGYEVRTSLLPLNAVPRAIVNHETTGVFKIVVEDQTQKILGIHVVAENAGDIIYAATLAVKFELTIEDLRDTLAPYLTMAEGMKLAALTFDKDVNKLSCCAG